MKNIEQYSRAFAEVVKVLKYIPLEDYEKIPQKYITFMEENLDENCSFEYNVALPFEKQVISENAKNILAMIFRLFIIDEAYKKRLSEKDIQEEIEKFENEMKFNSENNQ